MDLALAGSTNSAFAQQGTIDWVQLSQSSLTASMAIYSRLSAANLDAFTVGTGLAICAKFRLSRRGEDRLRECLSKLHCFSVMGNVLWIGFGMKHIIRVLAETNHGMSTITMCGALSEVMPADLAAVILDDLARAYGAPEDFRPSLQQWENLIKACSGVLSSSNFGKTADQFMRFHSVPSETPPDFGDPDDTANALKALACLSTGSLTSIELHGGPSCGWIAAIASWFLGIEIEIRRDGTTLFQSDPTRPEAQLLVSFSRNMNEAHGSEVRLASQSYFIRRFQDHFIDREKGQTGWEGALGSRVPWQEVIENTFGTSGKRLLKTRSHFARLLGSVARVFEAVRNSELAAAYLAAWDSNAAVISSDFVIVRGTSSFGQRLVSFMITRLPELKSIGDIMYECLNISFEEAFSKFEDAAHHIAIVCDCNDCSDNDKSTKESHGGEFCLAALASSLIHILHDLSYIQLDIDQLPFRNGFLLIYHETKQLGWSSPLNMKDIVSQFVAKNIFSTAEAIYTGFRDVRDSTYWRHSSAVSLRGVVLYLGLLRDITDKPEEAARVCVITGAITLGSSGRMADCILDGGRTASLSTSLKRGSNYRATNYQPLQDLANKDTGLAGSELKMSVKQTAREFFLTMQIFAPGQPDDPVREFGPRHYLEVLAAASWKVHCRRFGCEPLKPPFRSIFTAEGEGTALSRDETPERNVVVRRFKDNMLARCWTVDHHSSDVLSRGPARDAILQQDECLSCCIRAALALGKGIVYIIT